MNRVIVFLISCREKKNVFKLGRLCFGAHGLKSRAKLNRVHNRLMSMPSTGVAMQLGPPFRAIEG